MKLAWPTLNRANLFLSGGLGKSDVLVEYDGPLLAMFSPSTGSQALGVAADWDESGERWVLADISSMEIEAMARGALPVREIFSKEELNVVDFDQSGSFVGAWLVEPASIPTGALPSVGAILPREARSYLVKKHRVKEPSTPRLRVAGSRVHGSKIEFSALSRITGTFQSLWVSLGVQRGILELPAAYGASPSTLMAGSFSAGSFAVEIQVADGSAFEKILAEYNRVVNLARGDDDELTSAISDPSALGRLREFMKALSDLRMEATLETASEVVYVGHARARVVSASIRAHLKDARKKKARQATTTTSRQGYFEEVGLPDKTFEFSDIETGEVIRGTMNAKLAKEIRSRGAQVGGKELYIATFAQKSDKTTLVSFVARQQKFF